MGDDIETSRSMGSDYRAALRWLSENQNKLNRKRCHYPLITYLRKNCRRPNGWSLFLLKYKAVIVKKERKVTHCYELVKLPVSHIVYILSQMYSCKFGKNVQNFADSCVNHC